MKYAIKYFFSGLLFLIISINCHEAYPTAETFKADGRYLDNITVNSPVSGELWVPGNEYEIKWRSTGNIRNVNIILLKKKQLHRRMIAANLENNMIYKWVVPNDIPASVSYQVKIEDSENPDNFYYSSYFEISNSN